MFLGSPGEEPSQVLNTSPPSISSEPMDEGDGFSQAQDTSSLRVSSNLDLTHSFNDMDTSVESSLNQAFLLETESYSVTESEDNTNYMVDYGADSLDGSTLVHPTTTFEDSHNVLSPSSQPDTPTDDQPYWVGRVQNCPKCSKRIMTNFLSIHLENCSASDDSITGQDLSSTPEVSLEERANHLLKYEVLLLTQNQIAEFNQLFSERKLSSADHLFQAWLILKNASLPTEAQALQNVLQSHTASNIPKKKTAVRRNLPSGPARYNPSGPEWEDILEEQAKKKKTSPSPKKTDRKSTRLNSSHP